MSASHPLDELAEAMLPAALDLICQVHDREAAAVAEILEPLGVLRLRALAVVLAALVPDDARLDELIAQTHRPTPDVTPERAEEHRRRLEREIDVIDGRCRKRSAA